MNITITAYYVLSNILLVANIIINYIKPVSLNWGDSMDIW